MRTETNTGTSAQENTMTTNTPTSQDTLDDAVLAALLVALDASTTTLEEASAALSDVRRDGFSHSAYVCEACRADQPCEIATPCPQCRELMDACDECIEEDRVALEAYEAAIDAEREAKAELKAFAWWA